MTSVPVPTFGARGYQAPSEDDILTGVTEDLNAAFGGNLNPSPATPQGQLATTLAALIGNLNNIFLLYTNLVDPALTYGRMQDAIARIYFIERIPSAPTTVQVVCTGASGVNIPAGAQVQDINQNLYVCTQAGVIGAGGTVTLTFANLIPGPTPCAAGALSSSNGAQIYQAVPGWDSIANPGAGLLGNDVETSTAFELRRSQSVAQNSLGSLPSILGAVLSLPGVLDCYVYENTTNVPTVVGGMSLVPNSVYVCVLGGNSAAIARAIWSRKAPGCAYNGNTTVTVQDTSNGYIPPYPTYQVSYETPLLLPIVMAISLANGPLVPSNAAILVQGAIISAFAGEDGGPRAKIGYALFASRFYSTLATLGPWVRIISILLGSPNSGPQFSASIAGAVLTVTHVYSGVVATGQYLFDVTGALVSGTQVGVQLSGLTGGVGTYGVNNAQTVPLENMSGVAPTLFEVGVNINQAPTITPANIVVTLS